MKQLQAEDGKSSPDFKVRSPTFGGLLAKIIIAVLSALLLVAVVLFVVFVSLYASDSSSSSSSSSSSASSPQVCQSEACLDLAVQIKGAMDESVDPCEDFYNFTCGNWPFFNHIPEGNSPHACPLLV